MKRTLTPRDKDGESVLTTADAHGKFDFDVDAEGEEDADFIVHQSR